MQNQDLPLDAMDVGERSPLLENGNRDRMSDKDGSMEPSGCWARVYPMGFWSELKELLKMAAPLIGQQLTMYMLGPVALMFCGHLGKLELDAVALACSLLNVFGISAGVGLSSACDTLFAQVYGSENKHKLGIVLQRSILFIGIAVMPCIAIHINAEAICHLLGQDMDVSRVAGDYMLVLLPGTISFFFYIPLLKYIQNQNIIVPTLVIGSIVNAINALLHYLLLYVLDYGIMASAVTQSICYFLFTMMTLGYIKTSGIYKDTWNGWDWECLQNWGQFLYLAIFGMLMICIEWWAFEAGIFLAGLLGTVELGAQSLVLQVEIVLYMFPLGNGMAASIRVGQFLGAGDAKSACTAARVAITFIGITGIMLGIMLVALKDYLPMMFSNDPDVIAVASEIFTIMGVYMLFDAVAGTCSGILRGCGNQQLGAFIVFFGYFMALVIGIPLMFMTSLRVPGFWLGLSLALAFDACIYLALIIRMDWEKEALLAYERVNVGTKKSQKEILEDEERRALMSSSNIHSHMSVELSRDFSGSTKPLPFATVLCRRVVGLSAMLAILVVGVILRLFVIDLDSPPDVISNHTIIVNSSTHN